MNVYLSKHPNESKRHIFYNALYYKEASKIGVFIKKRYMYKEASKIDVDLE